MKTKTKPFHFLVPITRVNEEERVVEGYAFVNETVPGEGGIRLKRSAMEAATADYMRWGAIREMHQPSAVGTALAANWDDKGLFLRAKIVDDAAWNKVKEGVYKAYSVGVAANVMRGKDVEACSHIETSLVDRPKDTDAVLTAYRVDDASDEYETEILDEPAIERAADGPSFADLLAQQEPQTLRSMAIDLLWGFLWDLQNSELPGKGALAAQAIQEFSDYICPILDAGELPERAAAPDLTRLQALETEQTTLLERAQTAESELTRVQAALSEKETALAAATERVTTLERSPVPIKPPVRYPEALERTFTANQNNGNDEVTSLRAQLAAMQQERPATEQEQFALINRMQTTKMQLQALGETI